MTKKELIQHTINKIGEDSIATTNRAVLTKFDFSFTKVQNVRRGIVLEQEETTRAPNKPDPNYLFDVQSVCNTIVQCTLKCKNINFPWLAGDNPVFIAGTKRWL